MKVSSVTLSLKLDIEEDDLLEYLSEYPEELSDLTDDKEITIMLPDKNITINMKGEIIKTVEKEQEEPKSVIASENKFGNKTIKEVKEILNKITDEEFYEIWPNSKDLKRYKKSSSCGICAARLYTLISENEEFLKKLESR